MDLFDYLNPDDVDNLKKEIEDWVNDYSGTKEEMAPMKKILAPWSKAKSKYLWDLLGHEFIISKNYTYEKSPEELYGDMRDAIDEKPAMRKFYKDFKNVVLGDKNIDYNLRWELDCLLSNVDLVDGVYRGDTVDVQCPSGKVVRVNKWSKPIKMIAKLAKEYDMNMDDFEAFRLEHSRVLNQKKLTGKLCLSIHPCDYATMSDNIYGWDSCMSWRNHGGYAQGTVEMMNSSMVVVAYLAGDKNMYFGNAEESWNSKKWRELFVVTPSIITEVAPYPYVNDSLTLGTLEWLRELAVKNLGWTNLADTTLCTIENNTGCVNPANEKTVTFDFCANIMYNDFRFTHRCYIHKNLEGFTRINYSGESECLWCGNTNCDFEDESFLTGQCCNDFYVCDNCGAHFSSEDELYEVEGDLICSNCYENYTDYCASCDEVCFDENLNNIYLANIEKGWISTDDVIRICNDCLYHNKGWGKYAKKAPTLRQDEDCHYKNIIDVNDLTEMGLEQYGFTGFDEALEYTPYRMVKFSKYF